MAYQHDLFISYMHDRQMEPWVHRHLLPFVETFVGNALNRPLKIFVDRNGITSGDSWPLRIQKALAESRCLLPVWSPLYFHSHWCRRECAAMLYRETTVGYRTPKNPAGLVIPINVFDGDFFPEKARAIQWSDFREYWIVGDGFSRTEKYVAFQERLRSLAPEIAGAIGGAPDWDKSWLGNRWINASDKDLRPKPTANYKFTGLE